jgi:hypothetical protein
MEFELYSTMDLAFVDVARVLWRWVLDCGGYRTTWRVVLWLWPASHDEVQLNCKLNCTLVQALRLCSGSTAHRGSKQRYSSTLSWPKALKGGEGSTSCPERHTTKYKFETPWRWDKCIETRRIDYNINIVKIKFIYCALVVEIKTILCQYLNANFCVILNLERYGYLQQFYAITVKSIQRWWT